MFYTIGEAAEKVGVAPSALRYYDKEGLLPFAKRSGGGIIMRPQKSGNLFGSQ